MGGRPDLPAEVQDRLPGWKRLHGTVRLLHLGSRPVVFRGLTLAELDAYEDLAGTSPSLAEDRVFRAAVLYPEDLDLDACGAFAARRLLQAILETQGLRDAKRFQDLLDEARREAGLHFNVAAAFVAHTFHLDPRVVREFSDRTLARYVAWAEVVTGRPLEIQAPGSASAHALGPESPFPPPPPPPKPGEAQPMNFAADNAAFRKAGFHGF